MSVENASLRKPTVSDSNPIFASLQYLVNIFFTEPLVRAQLLDDNKPFSTGSNVPAIKRRKEAALRLCMKLWTSNLSPPLSVIQGGQDAVIDMIIKKCSKFERYDTARKFSKLEKKLRHQSKWKILYVLFSVAKLDTSQNPRLNDTLISIQTLFDHPGNKFKTGNSPQISDKIKNDADVSSSRTILLSQYQELGFYSHDSIITERLLVRDIIFTLQGIEGKYIFYDKSGDEKNHGFAIRPNLKVSNSTRIAVMRICELGFYYKNIKDILDTFYQNRTSSKISTTSIDSKSKLFLENSMTSSAFASAVSVELDTLFASLAVIESQMVLSQNMITLNYILSWSRKHTYHLHEISALLERVRQKNSTEILSILHKMTLHGNSNISSLGQRLLQRAAVPLASVITRWVLDGVLEDPFNEFFIIEQKSDTNVLIWNSAYRLNTNSLPVFITHGLAKKIVLAGKTVYFIRNFCAKSPIQIRDAYSKGIVPPNAMDASRDMHDQIKSSILSLANGASNDLLFTGLVDGAIHHSSTQLKKMLFEDYRLIKNLNALKNFVLLGQGDFIEELLDSLGTELNKPASLLLKNNLLSILESSLRSSCTASADEDDTIERVDVRLYQDTEKDVGWDVFSLVYRVNDDQLAPVFSPDIMNNYSRVFQFLWKLKRVEYGLSKSWRLSFTKNFKSAKRKDLFLVFKAMDTLRMKLTYFIQNVQYYVMFDAVESAWKELNLRLSSAGDLDEIIAAHMLYMTTILERTFLSDSTKWLRNSMKKILQLILEFLNFENSLRETFETNSLNDPSPELEKLDDMFQRLNFKTEVERFATSFTKYYSVISKALQNIDDVGGTQFNISQETKEMLVFLGLRLDFNSPDSSC